MSTATLPPSSSDTDADLASPASDADQAPKPSNRVKRWRKNISSNELPLKVIAFVVVSGIAMFGGGVAVFKSGEIRVEFPTAGTTLVTRGGHPEKAQVHVAASDLWVNTGLEIGPRETVIISASGRVNLAIGRLVDAAKFDVRPTHGWVGPEGVELANVGNNSYRNDLKLMPTAKDGALLAYLHKDGDPIPGRSNPKPGELIVVGAGIPVTNNHPEKRRIWLVVNDAVLDGGEKSKLAFLHITKEDADTMKAVTTRPKGFAAKDENDPASWTRLEKWDNILTHQYFDVWFDDNIGFFHVQLDFTKQG